MWNLFQSCNSSAQFPVIEIHHPEELLNFTKANDDLISSSSDDFFVNINPPKIAFTKRPNVCNDCGKYKFISLIL